jgi:hypothetical protein
MRNHRGKVLVIRPTGELESDQLEGVAELLERKIEKDHNTLVLLDLRRYEGAHDLETAWRELRLVTHYADKVEKIAVIGSLDWQKLATALVSPFTRAEERFFEPDEMEAASKWLWQASD